MIPYIYRRHSNISKLWDFDKDRLLLWALEQLEYISIKMSVLNIARTSWITSACEGMNISQKMCLLSWVAREVPVYGPGRERSKPPVFGDERTTIQVRELSWYLACPFSPYPTDIWTLKKNHESGRASSVGWYEAHLFGPDIEVTWGGMDAYPPPRIVPKTSDEHWRISSRWLPRNNKFEDGKKHSIVIQVSYMFTNKYMYIYIYTRYHPCMVYI